MKKLKKILKAIVDIIVNLREAGLISEKNKLPVDSNKELPR